jgi:hypothetical protein
MVLKYSTDLEVMDRDLFGETAETTKIHSGQPDIWPRLS